MYALSLYAGDPVYAVLALRKARRQALAVLGLRVDGSESGAGRVDDQVVVQHS